MTRRWAAMAASRTRKRPTNCQTATPSSVLWNHDGRALSKASRRGGMVWAYSSGTRRTVPAEMCQWSRTLTSSMAGSSGRR